MKTGRLLLVITLYLSLMVSLTSCLVLIPGPGGHGKHKGWYKHPHNPHHPRSTNPGHTRGW
jgi:hypothetical protein